MNTEKYEALKGLKWGWETYANITIVNPYTIFFVLIMSILILFVNRKNALIPIISVALFITATQKIVIAGADFHMLRVVIFVGAIRVFIRKEYIDFKFNKIDKFIFAYSFVPTLTNLILWGNINAVISGSGFTYTAIGSYFLSRLLIRDIDEILHTFKVVTILSMPLMVFMLNEQITGKNLFGFLGGVPEYTAIRDGKLRSQGSFSHPIMAGSFGASLMPLLVGFWQYKRKGFLFLITGIISVTLITFLSNSSGPYITYLTALLGLMLWKFRKHIRKIFWGGIITLFILHFFIMNGPVWRLIGLAGIVSGSTASFRVRLINAWIDRFPEWWLAGTYGSGHWGWGLEDVTNWYVRHSIDGGLLLLTLFIIILCLSFKTIGNSIRKIDSQTRLKKLLWSMGVCLFSHTVSFMGVSYFGQMRYIFYIFIGMISTINILYLSNRQESSSILTNRKRLEVKYQI